MPSLIFSNAKSSRATRKRTVPHFNLWLEIKTLAAKRQVGLHLQARFEIGIELICNLSEHRNTSPPAEVLGRCEHCVDRYDLSIDDVVEHPPKHGSVDQPSEINDRPCIVQGWKPVRSRDEACDAARPGDLHARALRSHEVERHRDPSPVVGVPRIYAPQACRGPMTEPRTVACIEQRTNGAGARRVWCRGGNQHAWMYRKPQLRREARDDLPSAHTGVVCLLTREHTELPSCCLGQDSLRRLRYSAVGARSGGIHVPEAVPRQLRSSCGWERFGDNATGSDLLWTPPPRSPDCREDRRVVHRHALSGAKHHGDLHHHDLESGMSISGATACLPGRIRTHA
jgi:hypothetical protein